MNIASRIHYVPGDIPWARCTFQLSSFSPCWPLPRDVVYYAVPPALVVKLGEPPPEHRYVRVAADILLITVGTAIVVDAVQDLGRVG